MKRSALILALVLCITSFSACRSDDPAETTQIPDETTASDTTNSENVSDGLVFDDCEEAVNYFRNEELQENEYYEIAFSDGSEFKEFKKLHKTEFANDVDGCTYYITISGAPASATVSFLKKRYPPEDAVGDTYSASYTTSYDVTTVEWADVTVDDSFVITLDVPTAWVPETEEGCSSYLRFNEDSFMYLRALTFNTTFKVDSDFILDSTIYGTVTPGGDPELQFQSIAETGKTKNGYEYVIYKYEIGGDYYAEVYLRIDDEYIISMKYWDKAENYALAEKSLDSVSVTAN